MHVDRQCGQRGKLVEKVVAHAAHDHGVAEVTPELAAKVKSAIKA